MAQKSQIKSRLSSFLRGWVMLIVCMILSLSRAQAQGGDRLISGVVSDNEGHPLIGATVTTPDGKRGVATDLNGAYKIMLSSTQGIIEISYLGYKSQSIVVGNRTVIDVVLSPDESLAVNEVVVIGYGQVKKNDLTGSVTNVKMSEIKDAPVTSIDQALQGRVAGMDIMSTSGDPSATTSIRIRGTRSISASNEPLIVVDGVIDAVSDLSDINASDIESISVLKDASSTAIYGSRGSNGVIIVTTKKGSGSLSKPNVTLKTDFGISQLSRSLDLMNAREFTQYTIDRSFFNSAGFSSGTNNYYTNLDPSAYGEGTDWLKAITRTVFTQNYNLSVSGRSKSTNYYANLGFTDTPGIIQDSGFRRFTGRFNINHKFAKWFELGFKSSYTFRHIDRNKAAIGGTNIWGGAIYLAPTIGLYDEYNPIYENSSRFNSPWATIHYNTDYQEQLSNTNVLIATFTPMKGMKIKSQNSYMVYQRHDYRFYPSTLPRKTEEEGAEAFRYEGDARRLTSENTISYTHKLKSGHKFDALAGFTAMSEIVNRFQLNAKGLISDNMLWNNMNAISSKENYAASTAFEKIVRESVLARFNYNYRSRYYLTLTARADASSNFAANNKWGFFPSGAFRWNIKNERWLKNKRWLNELALRLSAGRTGNNAISVYRSLEAYSTSTSGAVFDGSQAVTVYPSRLENPDLTWEKTTLYNAAIDFGAFDNRLNVSLEGYFSRTTDLLLTLQTAHVTGFTSRYTNIGSTTNSGVELTIESRNIVNPKFQWNTTLTLSHNNQMVEDIGHEEYIAALSSGGNSPFMMYGYKAGYPLNSLWGFKYAGVWKTAEEFERNQYTHTYVSSTTGNNPMTMRGYPKYVDTNNDGILSEADLVYMGSSDPFLYGGLQNTFHIGRLKLGIYFTYSLGGKIYNYSELAMGGGNSSNQYRYMIDAWHPVRNPESDLPRAGTDDILVPSDLQIHDASYLRLQNVNLSYTFDLRKKTKALRDITLSLVGNNLWLWSKYNGFDPDVSTESDGSTLRRVDLGAYPRSRTFVFSIQIRY